MIPSHVHRFGVAHISFELSTNWDALADHWRRYTAFFQTDAEPTVRYRAWRGERSVLERSGSAPRVYQRDIDLFPMLEDAFLNDLVASMGARFPIYHSAVIAEGGAATIYIGEPNAGKSTLCVRRVQEGAVYLSDEMAAVDGDQVIALPRPICFNELENPTELMPLGDERFEAFGYDFIDKTGSKRRSHFFLPRAQRSARAGDRYPLKEVVFLDPVPGGPPGQIPLTGAEKRARLALSSLCAPEDDASDDGPRT